MKYTADDINRAVYAVISTPLKKNCKWAIKILEEEGYGVVKAGKYGLGVVNPKTGRYVCICGRNTYKQTTNIWHHSYKTTTTKCPEKFDYFNCLNTLPNNLYWEHLANLRRDTATKARLYRLKEAKRTIQYREQAIQETLKKIEDLQKTLIREAQWLEQQKANLTRVREELGLSRK